MNKTARKSTNQIKHYQEHPNFLVYDKYERSYSPVKLIENPENPDFEAGIVRGIWDFDDFLSMDSEIPL